MQVQSLQGENFVQNDPACGDKAGEIIRCQTIETL